jgi:hypothetical protein
MPIQDIPYEEMKALYVSPQSKLNEDLVKTFDDLFTLASPKEYRDTLSEIYHMYILHEHKDLPPDFAHIASRMVAIMDFLKACE